MPGIMEFADPEVRRPAAGKASRGGLRRLGTALAALAFALTGCRTVETTQAGIVGVYRKQTMTVILTQQDVQAASARRYTGTIARAQRLAVLNRDPQQVLRVRTVAARLIAETPAFREDAIDWNWEVNVVATMQVNAWSMLGGKIIVYSGLLDLDLTDDELAAVLGHEIAHVIREHAREMPSSSQQEVEADIIGVELAARAGYDPRAAISVRHKLDAATEPRSRGWLSSHPDNDVRLRELDVAIENVLPLRGTAPITSQR